MATNGKRRRTLYAQQSADWNKMRCARSIAEGECLCVCECAFVCVHACVRACMRAWLRACVLACLLGEGRHLAVEESEEGQARQHAH
jgi:hypothetical protein